jgi:3-deoxy-7-phosphoheptulonate synthase
MSRKQDPDYEWSPDSWQKCEIAQMPKYPDEAELSMVVKDLSGLPPLVTSWEIEDLREKLAEVSEGKRFLLHGGDCSESFADCSSQIITNKLKILLQMSLVLVVGSKKPVIRLGRIAGQYAKPRSSDLETRDGVTLPSYRGDLINKQGFTPEERIPDPQLLLRGYERAALTTNFIRALMVGGFADLHHPEYWDLAFMDHSSHSKEYQEIVDHISHSLDFLESVTTKKIDELERVDFFTSHEGLHLYYEQAQTRQVPRRSGWYNVSTHFPWIGDRTRSLKGAHVEYFSGIRNPIGVKIGPTMTPLELTNLVDILNPTNEPGRLTLIHRFGTEKIQHYLPPLIKALKRSGQKVVWVCDPMHGNTETTKNGYKTRSFDRILEELESAFYVHNELGTYLGGVHLELTGDNVTECVGGARGLAEKDLGKAYRTQVDPRLNYEQAVETAMLVAELMKKMSGPRRASGW